jgi:hypothetical protein
MELTGWVSLKMRFVVVPLTVFAALIGFGFQATPASASAVDCIPINAPDKFGPACVDNEALRRRALDSRGMKGEFALNILIPPHDRPESQIVGACNRYREPATVTSRHGAFIAFTTGYGMLGVPGNEAGALDSGQCNLDVYVRSIVSHGRDDANRYAIRMASTHSDGTRISGRSQSPAISADGHYVCFSNWNDTTGAPTGIYRKDMWDGSLVVIPDIGGTCSVANDGKVAGAFTAYGWFSGSGAWKFDGSTPVELWSEHLLNMPQNLVTSLGRFAFSPGGRELLVMRSSWYYAQPMKVTFPVDGGEAGTSLIPNVAFNAAGLPAHASIGDSAMWFENDGQSAPRVGVVRHDGAVSNFVGDSVGRWLPKYEAVGSDTEYWAYTGLDPAQFDGAPGNEASETIYLTDSSYFDPNFNSGNANACPVATDAEGNFHQSGTSNPSAISGDGKVVAFWSDKPMLDETGTSGTPTNGHVENYARPNIYVRFSDSYDDCLGGDKQQSDEVLAQRYAPYMLYDKKELYYSSDTSIFETGRYPAVGPTKLKRCISDFGKSVVGKRTHCGNTELDSYTLDADVRTEELTSGAESERDFLDMPGEASDVIGKATSFHAMRALGAYDAAYYKICSPSDPNSACPGGKVIQYWLPYYQSWNAQSDIADGYHESDWEMIQVVFNDENKPVQLGYASHETGYKVSWKMFENNGFIFRGGSDGGDHPMVFPSRGAHGSYFESGKHGGSWEDTRFFADHHELCTEGAVQPAPCHAVVPTVLPFPSSVSSFRGKWGNVPQQGQFGLEMGGAGGANVHDQWTDPMGWQDSLAWNEKSEDVFRQTHNSSGPVEVSYVSSDGKRAGSEDGILATGIPGAMYDDGASLDSRQLRLPDAYDRSAGGTLKIAGAGDGVMKLVSVIPDPSNSVTAKYTFDNISVSLNFRAELRILAAGSLVLDVDSDGDGTFEAHISPDTVDTTTLDVTPPAEVSNVRVRSVDATNVRVTWGSAGDDGNTGSASSYRVTYGQTPLTGAENEGDHSYLTAAEPGATQQFDVSELESGQLYYFEVRAIDDVGLNGPNSAVRQFRLQAPPETTIDTGPGVSAHGDTFDFTFHSSDPSAQFECLLDDTASTEWQPCASPYTTERVLHSGPHTFQVRAVDEFENVDPTPAEYEFSTEFDIAYPVTKARGPDGSTSDSTPTFEAAGLHNGNRLVCKLDDDVRIIGCGNPFTTATLPNGPHTMQMWTVADSGGAASTPIVWNFTVATGKPVPETILDSAPPSTPITRSQAESQPVVFHSSLPHARFECREMPQYSGGGGLDYGEWLGWGKWCTTPLSSFGGYSHRIIQIRAVVEGTVDPTPIQVELQVDEYGPDVAIVNGPFGATTDSTPEFEFVSSELSAAFACSVDGAVFTPCTSPFTAPSLGDGAHSFVVKATDALGLSTSAARGFTVETGGAAAPPDTSPPDTSIRPLNSVGPNNAFGSSDPYLTFDATESASYECAIDSEAFEACGDGWSPTLMEGPHTLRVRATDQAGNVDPTPASVDLSVDRTPPVIDWTSPLDGAELPSGDVQLEVSASGANLVVCGADFFTLESLEICDDDLELRGLLPGTHVLVVLARDEVQNTTMATRTINVADTTSEVDTTIQSGPANSSTSPFGSVSYSFSASKPGSTFECAYGPTSTTHTYQPCTSPVSVSGPGARTFRVRAIDGDGAVDQTPAVRNVILEDNAVSITSPYDWAVIAPGNAPIEFTGDAAVTEFSCDVDEPFTFTTPCGSPWTLTGASDGHHVVAIRASNAAGDFSVRELNVTVDTTPPALSFIPPLGAQPAQATLGMTVSDPHLLYVECRVDAGAWQSCGMESFRTEALTTGTHTAYAVAHDAAGNQSTASVEFTVEATAPTLTVTSPSPGAYLNDSSPTFTYEAADESSVSTTCSLDGSGGYPCESPYTAPYRPDGEHTLVITATDSYGNATSATIPYWIDTRAPSTIFTAPSGLTNDSTPVMRMTFNDASPISSAVCRLIHAGTGAATAFPCVDGAEAPSLPDGVYWIYANPVTDAAGNVGSNSGGNVTIDSTGPQFDISSPAQGSTSQANMPSVVFTTDEVHPGDTPTCVLDEGTANEQSFQCSSYTPIPSTLSDGSHTLSVRGADALGNFGSAEVTFVVDTTAPTVSISAPLADALLSDNTPLVAFAVADTHPGSTTTCAVWGSTTVGAYACDSGTELPPLNDGLNTLQVAHTDSAGNTGVAVVTFNVDATPPETVIDSEPPPAHTNLANFSFNFHSSESGSTFECSIDAIPFHECNNGYTISGFNSNQPFTFSVRAVDPAGNVDLTPASVTWTFDDTAPIVNVSAPSAGALVATTTPSLNYEITDTNAGDVTTCSISGATFVVPYSCTSGTELPTLNEGAHTLTVEHVDKAGNAGTSSVAFSVDTSPPDTVIDSGAPPEYTNASQFHFFFHSTEAVSTFECSVGTGSFHVCVDGFGVGGTQFYNGGDFKVRAVDSAGNVDPTPAIASWTFDDIVPIVNVSAPVADGSVGSTPALTYSIDDTNAGTQTTCSISGATTIAIYNCASGAALPALNAGVNVLAVTHTDRAGNAGTTFVSFTVDLAAPDTVIDSGTPPLFTNQPSFTPVFHSTESGSSFECAIGVQAFQACSSGAVVSGLSQNQTHTFHVRAIDDVGNVDASPASVSWTFDDVLPVVSIASPAANALLTTRTPTATFTATDENAGTPLTRCAVTGATTVASYTCSSGATLPSLNDGPNTLAVTHTDKAGNATTATRTFIVDLALPNTFIDAPTPSAVTNQTSATFNFSSSEFGSTFQCSMDSTTVYTACTSPRTYTGLTGNATHTFRVRAVDAANRTDTSPAAFTWTIDTVAPALNVTAPAADAYVATRTPTVTYTVTDTNVSTQTTCAVSGATTIASYACASGSTLPSLNEGVNQLTVTHTDRGGNATARVISFTVDVTAPTVSITSPTNGSSTLDTRPTLSFSTSDNFGVLTPSCYIDSVSVGCASLLPALTIGTHTLRVAIYDRAYNLGQSSLTFTVLNPEILSPANIPVTTGTTENLTASGTVDWSHWGTVGSNTWDRKSSGGGIITNVTPVASTTFSRVTTGPNVRWTDGVSGSSPPQTSSTTGTTSGIAASNAVGNGFTFRVNGAQNTEAISLRLHVGAMWAQGKLELWWSSSPGTIVTDTSLTSPGSSVVNRIYSISMRPPQPSDTLNVRWTQNTSPSTMSKIQLYSASLTKVGASRAAAPEQVNLTTDVMPGKTMIDWAHWGGAGQSLPAAPLVPIAKSGGTAISNATQEGGGTMAVNPDRGTDAWPLWSWDDGDTTAAVGGIRSALTNSTGAIDRGFSFTVPASATAGAMRTLKLYVGAWVGSTTATVPAKLELFTGTNPVPIYTDIVPAHAFGNRYYLYTINFRTPAANTLMKVKWSTYSANVGPYVDLRSATLLNN